MSELIIIAGGRKLPELHCNHCRGAMASAHGKSDGRYTMQCDRCGLRAFIWTFPGERIPLLILWKNDCPDGVPFYDFARPIIEAHRREHSNVRSVAAPG